MAEYIKREDVLHRFTFEHGDYIPEVDVDNFPNMVSVKDIRRVIMELPAADVVEVVRCRDCKYRTDRLYCRLRKTPYIVTNIDFCSYGEPLEG